MTSLRVAIGIFLAGAMAGCGSSRTPTSPSTPSTPTTVIVTIPDGASRLGASAFVPNPVTVSVGTTVTWNNTDPASSSHDVFAENGAFNSGQFGNGRSFSFTFQSRGTFPYYCARHPTMVGTVIVQ